MSVSWFSSTLVLRNSALLNIRSPRTGHRGVAASAWLGTLCARRQVAGGRPCFVLSAERFSNKAAVVFGKGRDVPSKIPILLQRGRKWHNIWPKNKYPAQAVYTWHSYTV